MSHAELNQFTSSLFETDVDNFLLSCCYYKTVDVEKPAYIYQLCPNIERFTGPLKVRKTATAATFAQWRQVEWPRQVIHLGFEPRVTMRSLTKLLSKYRSYLMTNTTPSPTPKRQAHPRPTSFVPIKKRKVEPLIPNRQPAAVISRPTTPDTGPPTPPAPESQD